MIPRSCLYGGRSPAAESIGQRSRNRGGGHLQDYLGEGPAEGPNALLRSRAWRQGSRSPPLQVARRSDTTLTHLLRQVTRNYVRL